jgi:hypothetical protein
MLVLFVRSEQASRAPLAYGATLRDLAREIER